MAEEDLGSDDELRAPMSTADQNDLNDDDFAYIEPGGEKDESGKTTPRSLRHFPIHDAAHVRNALARAPQSPFGDKAMPKIVAAAKKLGIKVASEQKSAPRSSRRGPRHRTGPTLGVELRTFGGLETVDDGSNIGKLNGKPIAYDAPYFVRDGMGPRGGFDETMRPGVVSELLAKGTDTRFLVGHDSTKLPLGRTTAGTLRLQDSPSGLLCEVDLDLRQSLAADLFIAVERGDIDQMSIGMVVGEDRWDASQENREVLKIRELADVSAVVFPASPTTSLEIAKRMAAERFVRSFSIESRARFRPYWENMRELRAGRIPEPEIIDAMSDTFRFLAEASDDILEDEELETSETSDQTTEELSAHETDDETRAEPTPQDKGVTSKLQALAQAHHDAVAAQMKDPDNATDPADQALMGHLQDIGKLIGKAQATQAVDSASDIPPGTLGGDDGTIGNQQSGDATVPQDGTGAVRKHKTTAELRREFELERIQRTRAERAKTKTS